MTHSFFQNYLKNYQPFKQYWNYEDGCLLLGCQRMYEATGERLFADFILDYLEQRVMPDGSIPSYLKNANSLDSYNCSKLLFFAAEQTGDSRYYLAIERQAAQLQLHPRTPSGLCWHKQIYPNQVWIDGIYMTAPFFAQYATTTGDPAWYPQLEHCFSFVKNHLRNPENGLYFHAIDESRTQAWANPDTGLSQTHWLRGEGWFMMAVADTHAFLPPSQHALRILLQDILRDGLRAILPYQTDSGMFCQVIDHPELLNNYSETSGSLMIAYALMSGAKQQILEPAAWETGLQILEAVKHTQLYENADGMHLYGICSAAGLGGERQRDGSPAYYLSEPVVADDPKGVGTLMMTEALRLSNHMPVCCHVMT